MPHYYEVKNDVLSVVREFVKTSNAGQSVVVNMSNLVEVTSQISMTKLETWERLLRWELFGHSNSSWTNLWRKFSPSGRYLSWLDLCNGDGYKREKILRNLTEGAPNSFFLALAVRRLNDWVPQVRQAAREKIPIIAENTDPRIVVEVLCGILPFWNSWGRITELDRQIILDFSTIDNVASTLKERIISSPFGPMSSILAQAGRTPFLDQYLTEIARNAIQPAVRAKAYSSILDGKMTWYEGRKWVWTDKRWCEGRLNPIIGERIFTPETPLIESLKLAAADRSPIVRRIAGDILIKELVRIGPAALKIAQGFSTDPYPSVAERGAFALKKLANSE